MNAFFFHSVKIEWLTSYIHSLNLNWLAHSWCLRIILTFSNWLSMPDSYLKNEGLLFYTMEWRCCDICHHRHILLIFLITSHTYVTSDLQWLHFKTFQTLSCMSFMQKNVLELYFMLKQSFLQGESYTGKWPPDIFVLLDSVPSELFILCSAILHLTSVSNSWKIITR